MSNDVQTSRAFQERMFDRIREQMGDLLADAELKALVDSAINKAFFEPVEQRNSYGHVVATHPPHFVALVERHMRDEVKSAIDLWLKQHPDVVKDVLDQAIARGLTQMISSYIDSKFQWPLQQLMNNLQQKGVLS